MPSFTPPTLTGSGTSFASAQSGGLALILSNLAAANPSVLTPAAVAILNDAKRQPLFQSAQGHLDNWTSGKPVDQTAALSLWSALAAAATALAVAFDEAAALIAANSGTLGVTVDSINATPVRKFP